MSHAAPYRPDAERPLLNVVKKRKKERLQGLYETNSEKRGVWWYTKLVLADKIMGRKTKNPVNSQHEFFDSPIYAWIMSTLLDSLISLLCHLNKHYHYDLLCLYFTFISYCDPTFGLLVIMTGFGILHSHIWITVGSDLYSVVGHARSTMNSL